MPFVPTHRARFLAQGLDLIGVVFGRHNGGVGRLSLVRVFNQ
jgi:hypothetical protein